MDIPLRFRKCRLGTSVFVAYGAVCLTSCIGHPDSSERLDDDIVFTGHAAEVGFHDYLTFAIDPTLHVASVDSDNSVTMSAADEAMSQTVTDHVADALSARGFNRVLTQEDPDLAATVTAISGLEVGSISGGGSWSGYYSDYWGYPGWGYYYPYDVYYTYQTGSLIIDIADLRAARTEKPAPDLAPESADAGARGLAVVWTMIGYKAYVDDDNDARLDSATQAIDQAFDQSPYLTRK
jgi:hypothetical protein